MKLRCVVTLGLLLQAGLSFGSQLTPILNEQELGVAVDATRWPETLSKDLTSGLTNRILIRVRLLRGTQILQQRAVEITVRYDLWDERFAMNVLLDGVTVASRTIEHEGEMLTALDALRLQGLFAITKSVNVQPYVITAEILLNPIDRERMDMIKKWVAETSGGPTDIGAHPGGWGVAIFNRIFEQYASGADFAAAWREISSSRPFKLEDLVDEGQ